MKRTFSAAAAALMAIVVGGCHETRLGARGTGDVSNPRAARVAYDLEVRALCGDGARTAEGQGAIRRHPYLQQVTQTSAKVLWTDTLGGEAKVRVTRPSGEEVLVADAEREATVYLSGARQMIAGLEGLEPSQTYCYEVEVDGTTLVSRTGFKTAVRDDEPVRFVVWGDSGTGNRWQRAVVNQIGSVPFDFILHMGDVAYDDGEISQFEYNVFGIYGGMFRSFPVFPSSGNHDYATDDAAPFREVFALPENGGPNGRERWYSFDWGNTHFAVLDTERLSSEQLAWFDDDLTRNQKPWTIVYFHKPPFSSGEHGSDEGSRSRLVPLLERHRVPLVLSGHEHDYERFMPINGVHYVVTGGGGAETRPMEGSDLAAFGEAVLHFVYVTIEGDTLRLHTIDGLGREFDSLVIRR